MLRLWQRPRGVPRHAAAYITTTCVAETRPLTQILARLRQAHAALRPNHLSQMAAPWLLHVTSSAEVGSSAIALGLGDQHHRDHRALAHSTRDFVRVQFEDALGRRSAPPERLDASRGAMRP